MATKGTSYGDVNFSVPEGADPLGIGVLDLGKSSYDPVRNITQGWEKSRQERLIRGDREQASYQAYMKNMPTVEGVNQKISSDLNRDLVKMGGLFQQQQKAGGLSRFAKTPDGGKLDAELARTENKMASEIPVYNHYSEVYEKDLGTMRNGANKDKIDWELTDKNVQRMNNAQNVEEFAQPFADNAGSLVVWKPEEVDMVDFINKGMGTFIKGTDKYTSFNGIDMTTGKLKETITEGVDQKKVYDGMMQLYKAAEPKYRNQIQQWYDDAPPAEKTTDEGVVMDPDAWFASQFAPEYGRKTSTKYTAIQEDDTTPTGLGSGIPRIDGEIDTNAMMEPIVMQVTASTDPVYKDKRFGRGQKLVKEGTTTGEEQEFESFNMPMSGINEVFDSMTPADAIDTSTGSEPDRTKVGSHKAASVSYMPTFNGENDVPVEMEFQDEDGQMRKKKYTVKPGKPIPMAVQREMIKQGIPMSYEPYLLTKTVYGAAQEEKSMGSIAWSDYVSKHGKTVITPWSSINNAFLTKLGAEEYQLEELKNNMAEMYNKLNESP